MVRPHVFLSPTGRTTSEKKTFIRWRIELLPYGGWGGALSGVGGGAVGGDGGWRPHLLDSRSLTVGAIV